MKTGKYAFVFNDSPLELFAGKVLDVTDGILSLLAIDGLDLYLVGDGPYGEMVERSVSQATFFRSRQAMLNAAKECYLANR